MDVRAHNRSAWDRQVELQNRWTVPANPETIAAARGGSWQILLTDSRPVPRSWFPDLAGLRILCLASGGGQQGPILAAAGAEVTVFDNSPRQLAQDRLVAQREGVELTAVEGDMRDLSAFADESFDLICHPISNVFVPEVRPIWAESYRVLRHGGVLLAAFMNPAVFVFDSELAEKGIFEVKHSLPYSDVTSTTDEERARLVAAGDPFEFSHSLEEQIGGQLEAGFVLTGFYEDYATGEPIAAYMPSYIATRAVKP